MQGGYDTSDIDLTDLDIPGFGNIDLTNLDVPGIGTVDLTNITTLVIPLLGREYLIDLTYLREPNSTLPIFEGDPGIIGIFLEWLYWFVEPSSWYYEDYTEDHGEDRYYGDYSWANPYWTAMVIIVAYVVPVMCVLGLVGNVLSFAVFHF